MTIEGEDLPFAVTVPFQMEVSFWDWSPLPKPFDTAKVPTGPAYRVSTWFWGWALDRALAVLPSPSDEADDGARYYPQAGLVEVRFASSSVWLSLDKRRRQLLDDYIDFAKHGLIASEPTVMETVLAYVASGRPFSLFIDGKAVSPDLVAPFFAASAALEWRYATSPGLCIATDWGRLECTGTATRETETVELRFVTDDRFEGVLRYLPSLQFLVDPSSPELANNPGVPTWHTMLPDETDRLLRQLVESSRTSAPIGVQPADAMTPARHERRLSTQGYGWLLGAVVLSMAATAVAFAAHRRRRSSAAR